MLRRRNPYYCGPVSDHFDGLRFFNPGHSADKTLRDLLRWHLGGSRTPWPRHQPSPFADKPPTAASGLRIAFVGHASFLLQVAGCNLLIDPVWAERASPLRRIGPRRVNPPGIAFDDLPPIHAILLTHNHYDHMDLSSLARLHARFAPRVVAPLGNSAILRRVVPETCSLDWGEAAALPGGVVAHLRPAWHWSARHLGDRRMALWGAYVLATPAGVVYHLGDSAYGDGSLFRAVAAEFGPPRVAMLPIGAYEPRWFMRAQHMNPEEAVRAMLDCRASQALGYHWGTFQLTDEAIDAPARGLGEALAVGRIPPERFLALRPGQVWST
ncbi:MAG TPA: MBL fold metallo-hydrolase [Acetobacteraceae bacterium]